MIIQYPANNQYTKIAARSILASWLATLLGATIWMKLYTNAFTPGPNSTISSVTQADFGGYAKFVVASFSAVNVDAQNNAYALSPLHVFQCDGTSGNVIQGAYLTVSTGTTATATNAGNAGNYNATFVITAAGTGYQQAPAVHLTGATGSTATAHAIIAGGIVTDIVLDVPGDGLYTTFTVVIDPPEELLIVSPFPQPVPVATATDAIAYIQRMVIPTMNLPN